MKQLVKTVLLLALVFVFSGCFDREQIQEIKKSQNIMNETRHNVNQKNVEQQPAHNINLDDYLRFAAASDHSLAIDRQGDLWFWGDISTDGNSKLVKAPKKIQGISNVAAVTGDWGYTLFLKQDGTVWGWGLNQDGQLGDGTHIDRIKPVQTKGLEQIKDISSYGGSALALKEDGTVWAWGDNSYGQLGTPRENGNVASMVLGLTEVVDIEAGSSCNVALKKDGTVWAWGNGPEVDLNTEDSPVTPSKVAGINSVVAVSAKGGGLMALKNDGTVWEWGTGGPPVKVEGLKDIKTIGLEPAKSYAVDGKGNLWTWETGQKPKPTSDLSGIVHVSVADGYGLARDEQGELWAWGDNTHGQLGDGTTESQSKPVKIALSEQKPLQSDYTDSDIFTVVKNEMKVNFSLDFPPSWEGKYVVKQYEDQVYVYHNTALDEPAWIMNISAVTKDEWKASVEAGGLWHKLGESDGVVIVFEQLAEQAYPAEYAEEEEEVAQMLNDIGKVRMIKVE